MGGQTIQEGINVSNCQLTDLRRAVTEAVDKECLYVQDSIGAGRRCQATGVTQMITEALEFGGNRRRGGVLAIHLGQQSLQVVECRPNLLSKRSINDVLADAA